MSDAIGSVRDDLREHFAYQGSPGCHRTCHQWRPTRGVSADATALDE